MNRLLAEEAHELPIDIRPIHGHNWRRKLAFNDNCMESVSKKRKSRQKKSPRYKATDNLVLHLYTFVVYIVECAYYIYV